MALRGFAVFILSLVLLDPLLSQQPIGQWREFLPYHRAYKLTATSDKIYCATPYSLFTVGLADNNIERFSKLSGLSEVGISALRADEQTNQVIVAYNNSSIDILNGNDIITIDAIKRKDIAADKKIYNIFCFQNKAYLSTGLGVIVIDLKKYEVYDTYVIGDAGQYSRVNGVSNASGFFYVACDEGLKKAPSDRANLADYRNWQLLSGLDGLPKGSCYEVLRAGDGLVVQKGDSLFSFISNQWKLLYASDWTIKHTASSSGKLVLCQENSAGKSRVVVLNADGSIERITGQDILTDPQDGLIVNDELWVADMNTGLARISANAFQQYQPASPRDVATGDMQVAGKNLWVAAGTVTPAWNNTFSKNGFYRFNNNEWTNYDVSKLTTRDSLFDFVTLAINPVNNDLWAGSFGGGLLHLKHDQSVKLYKEQSFIEPALSDAKSYRVAGLAFDIENNLWISNFGAAQNLVVLKHDGNNRKFSIPYLHSGNALAQIVIDGVNQKWIVSPNGNGLFCFNHGASIENTGDDRWKYFRAGRGNGNLPDNNVLCIAKDKNGFIWIGTSKGIGIIYCTEQVFNVQGCEAVLPVVQQDNFAGYLFSSEQVQCIAVDGADRKWIGTKNGAWLISSDGSKTIYRFREENSALLSNDVRKIAIDPVSGEVFFSTSNGICSFRSTATEGGTINEQVLVFPQPVPPGFNGIIAIRGLVNNAIVKITELDGRLVYQTRATGGQATWNGRNYSGGKVSSGIYLVVVSDESRQEKIVTKIVIIR